MGEPLRLFIACKMTHAHHLEYDLTLFLTVTDYILEGSQTTNQNVPACKLELTDLDFLSPS